MDRAVVSGSAAVRAFDERVEALRGSSAFRNYEAVRQWVIEMRAEMSAAPEYRPSAYWVEDLSNFEYMLDASPFIIDKLRHHAFHITGLRVFDYRTHRR